MKNVSFPAFIIASLFLNYCPSFAQEAASVGKQLKHKSIENVVINKINPDDFRLLLQDCIKEFKPVENPAGRSDLTYMFRHEYEGVKLNGFATFITRDYTMGDIALRFYLDGPGTRQERLEFANNRNISVSKGCLMASPSPNNGYIYQFTIGGCNGSPAMSLVKRWAIAMFYASEVTKEIKKQKRK